MQIRPHHLLCIGNFVGEGYSEDFTQNMKNIVSALNSGESFVLTDKSDDICKKCPFDNVGICKTEEKVRRYDNAAKDALNVEYGKKYKYADIKQMISEQIYSKGKRSDICGDCEWADLCNEIEQKKF